MAEQNAGSIVYDISADVLPLLQASREAQEALDKIDGAARSSGKGLDGLDQSSSKAGNSFSELAGYANSMDNQLRKLNTSVSGIARAMEEARTGTGSTTSEFSRAQAVIEALGNQVAILDEAQQNGARSAAVFAAQLRAGNAASDEEKRTIGELAGTFYDMKEAADQAAKASASIAAASRQAESSVSGLEKEVSVLSAEMLAGSRTAAILAAQLSAGEGASEAQKARIAELAGSLYDMREAQKSASAASAEAAKQLAQQASEANRISGITADLSNQIAILSEQQTSGARSAAILAAQLRAGASATDADKQKIAQLTGQLYDMKTSTDTGAKSHGNWKTSMQQAGYQVQDFIVQVQGGQSALVAFSQQGSQLAGAFGPGGAVIGAIIALGSVLTGVLITSLNGGKNAMDALKDAAEAMDKVITVSSQGVAALSDKYAALARTNTEVATLMRNQALLEYNQAIAKIPKAITDAADSFVTLGDRAVAAIGGASPSIKKFNDELAGLNITTDDWSDAISQANSLGQYAAGVTNSLSATVNTLASRLGISQQQAFSLAKQLSDLSKNPSPEALQTLAMKLQEMKSSSVEGQAAITELVGKVVDLAREAANAKFSVDSLNRSTDNLTSGQKGLIKQSERNLALSKLQGAARAKLQAQYAAEDAGLSKDDPHTVQMMNDAAATYANTEAQKKLQSEQKKGATQAESIAQKLANLKQQSELAADSTQQLSREQAILNAQQSLGKGASQEQIALAGQYAAQKWDTANAIKAQAAAEKLLPETKENASYKQDMTDLKTALDAKKITQQQYDQTSEQLEQQHLANLAKIRAQQQSVNPVSSARAEVDPVQQLANQNNQKLALMQQYQQQEQAIIQQSYQAGKISYDQYMAAKQATDAQYLALRTAQENQFNTQMTDAQWQLLSQQSLGYDMLTSAVDAFSGNASNALTGLLTGTMSAQEAFRSLGNTILNSVINSIVQVGVEALKNYILGQTLGAASVASSVGMAATTATAWAPAAALASLATLGANAAPASAGITSTVGLAQGLALTGARYNGGPVSAGGLYQVGENGKPEIYKASNGSQYMIPGDNGSVLSNKDITGNGSGLSVTHNVYNYANGVQVDTQSSQSDGKLLVETFITDMQNGGPMSSQVQSTFGLSRKATGEF